MTIITFASSLCILSGEYIFEVFPGPGGSLPDLIFTNNITRKDGAHVWSDNTGTQKGKKPTQFVKDAFHHYIVKG